MRSRIYFTENAGHSQVKQEIEAMEKECTEEELTFRKNLQFSKAPCVSLTAKAYEEIELIIQRAKKEDFSAEEKILLAEYALDFAMQAADRALLSSLKAIDAQMTQQEQDERSFP